MFMWYQREMEAKPKPADASARQWKAKATMERNPNRQSAETPNGRFKLTGNERNLYDVAPLFDQSPQIIR